MAKGAQWERDLSRILSLWWSNDFHDDLCWRTSQSGGRATVRARKGRRTSGHCGDLCATDRTMEPFFRVVTPEVKRGYNSVTPMDLLDYSGPVTRNGRVRFDNFVAQAEDAAVRASTPYWMLIHRRDKRAAMVYVPAELWEELGMPAASVSVCGRVYGSKLVCVKGMSLTRFLKLASPTAFKSVARKL